MSRGSKDDQASGFFLSATSLVLEFRHFIDSHATLSTLNQAYPSWGDIVQYCSEIEMFPKLMKAITDLHSKSQIDFERAMFCSWATLLVSKSINLAQTHQRSLFLAGLFQDLGKYAVETDIQAYLAKLNNGPFCSTLLSGAGLDSHPLVASTYLEHVLEDNLISELVLHHHARDDGTGYPQHIGESQLDLAQQLLIISNELSDRLDRMGGHNQLPNCLPDLQLGTQLYFKKAHQAWADLLFKHFDYESRFSDPERGTLVLSKRREMLEKMLGSLICVSGELIRYDFDLHVHGLRAMIQKMAHLFTDSGLLNKQVFDHLDFNSQKVLLEMELMFAGMPRLLRRCDEFLSELLASKKYSVDHSLLGETKTLIRQCITELAPPKQSIFR